MGVLFCALVKKHANVFLNTNKWFVYLDETERLEF